MRVDNLDIFFNEYKSFIRDFKMDSLNEESVLSVNPPKKNIFSLLYWRGNNKLNELMEMGGIIVGSRALKFYYCGKTPLIDRKCDDWDIVIDKESFINFCSKNGIYNMDYLKNNIIRVDFKTGIFVGYDSYSSYRKNYIFKHQFDVIALDDLPEYTQVGKYRIAKLENILDEKINLIKQDTKSMTTWANYDSKHFSDCNEIMTKIKSHKNEKNLY